MQLLPFSIPLPVLSFAFAVQGLLNLFLVAVGKRCLTLLCCLPSSSDVFLCHEQTSSYEKNTDSQVTMDEISSRATISLSFLFRLYAIDQQVTVNVLRRMAACGFALACLLTLCCTDLVPVLCDERVSDVSLFLFLFSS